MATTNRKPIVRRTPKAVEAELKQKLDAVGTPSTWQPHDFQVRQLALETAAKLANGGDSTQNVLDAAEKFHDFLTGK